MFKKKNRPTAKTPTTHSLSPRADRRAVTFICQYYHDGGWWAIELHAYDFADADARILKLGNLQLLGLSAGCKIRADLPGANFLVRAYCWLRTKLGR